MTVENLVRIIGADFYTGIPDTQLKALCNYLMDKYGTNAQHHIIAANEGSCTALAAGYYLATGEIPVVYMQNSGEGNIVNPVASLLNDMVYAIPVIFIIGWRGQPGIPDEPQHIYQGKVTIKLLEDMDITPYIISKETTEEELSLIMDDFNVVLATGKSVAFVICKDSITYNKQVTYNNAYTLIREEVIRHIVNVSGTDPIISTTGKISRELFEVRAANNQEHKYDFLTVGSMGHSSSIALSIALNKPETTIWCVDGDGAVLMHMGAIAVLGMHKPKNLIHIVINNGAHETVGGMPTAANEISFADIAKICGYDYTICVDNLKILDKELKAAKMRNHLSLIEVRCAIGARDDLGRPTVTTLENKKSFMEYLKQL